MGNESDCLQGRETLMFVSGMLYSVLLLLYSVFYRKRILPDLSRINTHSWVALATNAALSGLLANIVYFWLLKTNAHPSSHWHLRTWFSVKR